MRNRRSSRQVTSSVLKVILVLLVGVFAPGTANAKKPAEKLLEKRIKSLGKILSLIHI